MKHTNKCESCNKIWESDELPNYCPYCRCSTLKSTNNHNELKPTKEENQIAEITKHEKLLEAIKDLEERDRLLMTMYYYERMTYREIADVMGWNMLIVARNLHSIVERLYRANPVNKLGD